MVIPQSAPASENNLGIYLFLSVGTSRSEVRVNLLLGESGAALASSLARTVYPVACLSSRLLHQVGACPLLNQELPYTLAGE